jgi:hypothetical protein
MKDETAVIILSLMFGIGTFFLGFISGHLLTLQIIL